MYDTICIQSPAISMELAEEIRQYCRKMTGIVLGTGEILYEITSGELVGSYDYRIRINVKDYEWQNLTGVPKKVKLDYEYIEIECSVHKLMMNHNCFGGPDDIKCCVKYLIKFINDRLNNKLPEWNLWKIKRVDIAFVYKFNSDKEIIEYLYMMKNMYYTRRKIEFWNTGFYVPGSTTTIKGYMKHPEFLRHDYKRIKKYCLRMIDKENKGVREPFYRMMLDSIEKVKEESKGIFRIEVEVHKRKLEELFNCEVERLDDDVLCNLYDSELDKIFWKAGGNRLYNKSIDVLNRLIDMYGELGRVVYGTWTLLALHGKEYAKGYLSKSTFYRHLRMLKDADCIWEITDVQLDEKFNVVLFRPTSKNAYNFVSDRCKVKMSEVS